MKKNAIILFVCFAVLLVTQGNLYAQQSLKKAYEKYLTKRDKTEIPDCETAFINLGSNYFFQKPRGEADTYDDLIRDRLKNKLPLLENLKQIKDLQEHRLLFFATYVYYQALAYKPNDTTITYTKRAEKWKGIMEISKNMLEDIKSNQKVTDKNSEKLLKKIIGKKGECVPASIREFTTKAISKANEAIDELLEEIKRDTLQLGIFRKDMESIFNVLDDKHKILKRLKLDEKPLDTTRRVADIDKFPIHRQNVSVKEEITVPEFALGAYCDNNVDRVAQDYATRNVKRINDIMDVRDDLVAYYQDVYKTIVEYKAKYPKDTISVPPKVDGYANSPIEIEVYVTGKADGSGGCYQKNWGNCSPIGYVYDGRLNPINAIVEYSFDGGKKIEGQMHVKSPSSDVNSNTKHVIEVGRNLNNLSLAFLRGYCFGKKVETALKNNPKNTKNERYKYSVGYRAFQYERFYDDKSRAFIIEMNIEHTGRTIDKYKRDIEKHMRKIEQIVDAIDEGLKDAEKALRILSTAKK